MHAPASAAGEGVAARVAAARLVDAVLHRGRSLKGELAQALPTLADPRDRALVEAVAMAVLRRHADYARALADWMPRPPGRRDGALRALLYAGFAQLDPIGLAPHAAVAATVDAARALGRAHQAGLVNALLRRAVRDGIPAAPPDAAWPEWLAATVRADWPDAADGIFAASRAAAPLWLRVNRRHGSRAAYLARLEAAGIAAAVPVGTGEHPDEALPPGGPSARPPFLADAIRLEASRPVSQLPGFDAGDVSVQDGSAQAVADALAPAPGARVLDACAAPGGKAAHLLERDPGLALLALDRDPRRVRRMGETFARLGLEAEVRVGDATEPGSWWDGRPFDAVLVDAPCSATGIVRRQPDVLLHRRPSDLAALLATQAQLLDALWPTLAPGGTLLYATCSILREENQAQVAAFLARTGDARAEPPDARFGHLAGDGRQRLPGEGGMDGFFVARLARRA